RVALNAACPARRVRSRGDLALLLRAGRNGHPRDRPTAHRPGPTIRSRATEGETVAMRANAWTGAPSARRQADPQWGASDPRWVSLTGRGEAFRAVWQNAESRPGRH